MIVILALCSFYKLIQFIIVMPKFGVVVRLVEFVFKDVYPFLFFFLIVELLFGLVYRSLGVDTNRDDYEELDTFWSYFFMTFRNSIGDLEPPGSKFWHTYEDDVPILSILVIIFFWIAWFWKLIFMLVVLLNFLIAYIS